MTTQSAYGIPPDETLKLLMGGEAGIARTFSKENIESCQQIIDHARENFFVTAMPNLETLKECVREKQTAIRPELLSLVICSANDIKLQADALCYPFIGGICGHITRICLAAEHMPGYYAALLRDLIETLRLAFDQRITGDGGEVGREMLARLERLPKK